MIGPAILATPESLLGQGHWHLPETDQYDQGENPTTNIGGQQGHSGDDRDGDMKSYVGVLSYLHRQLRSHHGDTLPSPLPCRLWLLQDYVKAD